MRVFGLALIGALATVGMAVLPGPAYPAPGPIAATSPPPTGVTIAGIPNGATHGVLTFSGINGSVTKAILRPYGPQGNAAPLNAGSPKGFTLDLKPPNSGKGNAPVCFWTSGPSHAAFARGTWSIGPAHTVVPINSKTITMTPRICHG